MSDEVAALISAINENPDPAHGDFTPAVHALVRLGLPALPAVLPLLESDDRWTRLRAQRVLEGATRAWVRTRAPERPMTRQADYAWLKLWQDNGSYDWQAAADARAEAIGRWRSWLAARSVASQGK
jgi:hypothetical protein